MLSPKVKLFFYHSALQCLNLSPYALINQLQCSSTVVLPTEVKVSIWHLPHSIFNRFMELEFTDRSIICTFVNDAPMIFYQGLRFSDCVLLLVTHAAPCMILAGKNLKFIFSQLIHMTYVPHGIHHICETIRGMFSDVNRFISCARKIFLKCLARTTLNQDKIQCG